MVIYLNILTLTTFGRDLIRSIRATGIQMLKGTGFADLVGSGEYVDTLDPSEDYQEGEEEAEFMEYEGENEEIIETKPDLGSLIGDVSEQEGT